LLRRSDSRRPGRRECCVHLPDGLHPHYDSGSAGDSERRRPGGQHHLAGRLLARTAAVTLDSNDIRLPVLTTTPEGTLEPLTTYTATMTTAARDLAGNPLPADFSWSFTTGATLDTTRPIVTATVPPANAPTNVAISAKIAVAFSEA